ncbi:MAG TPA: hypothetical protein VE152_11355 [Acidimicrobiales bacterium]|jgi:hypothetical protein|nr:hypothetical protein [Acidimicrobiales bacterium]
MPTLYFEGETHEEIVRKVRRWLSSTESRPDHVGPVEAVEQAAELTKDALSLIAAAAPGPIAHNEVVKGLAHMGYEATDQTKQAVLSGLNAVSELSGDRLFRRIEGAGRAVTYEMGTVAARQVLRALRP